MKRNTTNDCYHCSVGAGLIEGDEVVLINDMAVSHMNWRAVMEAIKGA